MFDKSPTHEVTEYAARAGPAVGTVGLHVAGVSIGDWVQLAVLVYTVMQIGLFIYSRYVNYKKAQKVNGS